jgi:RecA/RadA recombinase
MNTENALEFLKKSKLKYINKIGIKPIDDICDIEGGEIIEIYGKSQIGKTELCMQ